MAMPDKIKEFGWFGAGWVALKGGTKDDDDYPPLNLWMPSVNDWVG